MKDAIRDAYLDAITERYDTEWVADHLPRDIVELDEFIKLDDLIERVYCEIGLAADELEYELPTNEEDE